MFERRSALRSLKPAEATALTLGLVAIFGNLVVALLVPVQPPDFTFCLIWLIVVTFFVRSAFRCFGSGVAIGILVGSLVLSEIVDYGRRRLRAETPRGLTAVIISFAYNLAVDGLG